jgi:medium-chain acyl-[acyl-carrier-protein] hydrolase
MRLRTMTGPWWMTRRHLHAPAPARRLFCFPYAGGSAAIYHAWPDALPSDVEVCAIQLPGRANRIAERPYAEMSTLVTAVTSAMLPWLDRPFALFGHSFGALVAFEVARAVRAQAQVVPTHLFVSGRGAPHLPPSRTIDATTSDTAFINALRELNGTPPEVLNHPEVLQLLLRTVRADFQVVNSYGYTADRPLSCPITAFGGSDDEESQESRLAAWRTQTSGPFAHHVLRGDHFFIVDRQAELLALLRAGLAGVAGEAGPVPALEWNGGMTR